MFGQDAVRYDRARPSYPTALIDDLVSDEPGRVLDVGCGTGKAARLFAARGCQVLGVEPDDRMAAVARSYGIPVEVATFEAWDPAGRRGAAKGRRRRTGPVVGQGDPLGTYWYQSRAHHLLKLRTLNQNVRWNRYCSPPSPDLPGGGFGRLMPKLWMNARWRGLPVVNQEGITP